MRPAVAIALLLLLLLGGCATAADIKPGVVQGIDDRGYVKTTEGFAVAVNGCTDPEIWRAARASVSEVRVSDSTNFWRPRSLTVLDDDDTAGVLRAKDDGWLNGVSYVGLYLHRVRPELRLVEVTAFWHGRTVVLSNPWEDALLSDIRTRLAACLMPSEEAARELLVGVMGDKGIYRAYPAPAGRPLAEPSGSGSAVFCRQRANSASGPRDAWLAEYRRCMAGY